MNRLNGFHILWDIFLAHLKHQDTKLQDILAQHFKHYQVKYEDATVRGPTKSLKIKIVLHMVIEWHREIIEGKRILKMLLICLVHPCIINYYTKSPQLDISTLITLDKYHSITNGYG